MADFVFLGMDWFGAFFSLMALGTCAGTFQRRSHIDMFEVTQHTFDVLGGILYIVV